MSRLGRHRLTPLISEATRAKRRIEQINKRLARARALGDLHEVAKLEDEKYWAIVNSIPR